MCNITYLQGGKRLQICIRQPMTCDTLCFKNILVIVLTPLCFSPVSHRLPYIHFELISTPLNRMFTPHQNISNTPNTLPNTLITVKFLNPQKYFKILLIRAFDARWAPHQILIFGVLKTLIE